MATLIVEPAIDSEMCQPQPDTNYGGGSACSHRIIYLGEAKVDWKRAIVNFDVSSLAGATIQSAKLERYIWNINNPSVAAIVARCTRPAQWTEDGVTWKKYDGVHAWGVPGGDIDDVGPPAKVEYTEPTATGWHAVTGLEHFVEDALENRDGIVALITRLAWEVPDVSTSFLWRAKDHGSNVWRLVVEYAAPAPPNPGRRGGRRSRLASGAPPVRPARPTQPAAGSRLAQPHRPR